MITTVFNTLFLAVYLLSAAVQYNDPDPVRWMLVYLAAALMCILQYRGKRQRLLPMLLLAVSLLWMGSLLPSFVGQATPAEIFASITMQTRAVEEAREFGGLLLVALWAGILGLRSGEAAGASRSTAG